MALLKARLKTVNTIELEIVNSFYQGITKKVYLRDFEELQELKITKQKRNKTHTIYQLILEENLRLDKEYEIVIDRALRAPLNMEDIVFDFSFDEHYYYDGPLGNFYSSDKTTFYVWAPTSTEVILNLTTVHNEAVTKKMNRKDKGVWTITLDGDYERSTYTYITKIAGSYQEAFDPYAYSSTPNSRRSVIVDLEKVNYKIDKSNLPKYDHFTDYIIYETSVRDFTVAAPSITHKAKFLGLTELNAKTNEGNSLGLDYLKELGITHLQLMPFYDFGSTLEEKPELFYNWGYDPVNYNVAEGGYITDVFDPYKRITEVKEMIQAVNNEGIYINMDVVYNHMFDSYSSCFHNLVPKYYFRYDKNGNMSNGSFCGNDTESTRLMMRRFILDSVLRWVRFYGVDGFRFDLMGIHDVKTMNLIREKLDEINKDIIVYGEGWHMPSTLKDSLKASIPNQKKVPNIAMFNDRFRDTFKGPHANLKEKGFLLGNKKKTNMAVTCYSGTTIGYKDVSPYLLKPTTTINYASCHDNYTIFDQYMIRYKDLEKAKHFISFNLSNLLLTQGIAFLHSGSEFFRTKHGEENSYNVSDYVNKIDWDLRDMYKDHVDFIKEIINIRKSFKGYRLPTTRLLKKHVSVKALKLGVIEYIITYDDKKYVHYINATNTTFEKTLDSNYQVLIEGTRANINGLRETSNISLPPFSLIAMKK